jgi:hypothetical protein
MFKCPAVSSRDALVSCLAMYTAALQKEILRHEFSTFVDEPPVSLKGGKGVVVPGCSTCRKRATINEFLEHIAQDGIPPLIERLSQEK